MSKPHGFNLQKIEDHIQYKARQEAWLKEAFCHKSFHKENPQWNDNEKLEFLGDAVLDLVVSDLLMARFKEDQEGSLSRKRASIVNEDRLFQLAKSRSMDQFLLVGKGERKSHLHRNPRIVASVFEAVVGAIYKDSGFKAAFDWIEKNFQPLIEQAFSEHDFETDYKTRFQEWVQETYKTTPRYEVIKQWGPDHARNFEVELFIQKTSWGKACGRTKKMASQKAAREALGRIKKP